MLIRSILFSLILVSFNLSYAQDHLKIEYIKKENLVYLKAKNITEKDYEFKFELTLDNLKVMDMIEKVKIPAGEEREFAVLEPIDRSKRWSYNYKYWYYRYFKEGVFKEIAKTLDLTEVEAENSIIVFDKDGCSRCDKTLNYLEARKIKHHILNLDEDRENAALMHGYISELGLNLTTITTPMILMGGSVNFNISNLDAFLLKMKKFAKEKGLK